MTVFMQSPFHEAYWYELEVTRGLGHVEPDNPCFVGYVEGDKGIL